MNAQIPGYALYGQLAELDGILLESLSQFSQSPSEATSLCCPPEWHQIVWIKAGAAEAILNNTKTKLYAPVLISVPPESDIELKTEATGLVLALSSSYINRIISQLEGMADPIQCWEHIISNQVLDRRNNRVSEIFDQIQLEYSGGHTHRGPALYGNTTLLIVEMARLLNLQPPGKDAVLPIKSQVVFRNFKALIEAHFSEHWKISQYAAALATNETALRRICKAVTGASPTEILQQRIVTEARRNLLFSDKSVTEICYDLGFTDPSHFTKYFANSQGLSPSAYRAQSQSRSS